MRFITPLWGFKIFDPSYPGAVPLAILLRPVGAHLHDNLSQMGVPNPQFQILSTSSIEDLYQYTQLFNRLDIYIINPIDA
jgi:hypothetical protein